jgi:hypothetical protein
MLDSGTLGARPNPNHLSGISINPNVFLTAGGGLSPTRDQRIQDLLEANNLYLERARRAERELAVSERQSASYHDDFVLAVVEAQDAADDFATENARKQEVIDSQHAMILGLREEIGVDCQNKKALTEPLTNGAFRVLDERWRQKTMLGYDDARDDAFLAGELVDAASAYVEAASVYGVTSQFMRWYRNRPIPECWPWDANRWGSESPYRDLVKAGALIIAELDRMDRSMTEGSKPSAPVPIGHRLWLWFNGDF